MLRIRLELNRPHMDDDSGATFAALRNNRYIGFLDQKLDKCDADDFSIVEGKIVHRIYGTMQADPQVGFFLFDFESSNGKTPNSYVHMGNVVVTNTSATLPKGISEADLTELAQVCFARGDIRLTESDATEEELVHRIKTLIGGGSESGKSSEEDVIDATGDRSRSRRCCRCTIV